MKPAKELLQNWLTILSRKAVNYQGWGTEPPKAKEEFAVVWLVDFDKDKGFGSKAFVITEALKQFMERKTSSTYYFTTNEQTGKKQGMYLEWTTRDKVWTSTPPEIIERITMFAPKLNEFVKKNGFASIPQEVIENVRAVHERCAVCQEMIILSKLKIHPKYADAGVNTYECSCGHRFFVAV